MEKQIEEVARFPAKIGNTSGRKKKGSAIIRVPKEYLHSGQLFYDHFYDIVIRKRTNQNIVPKQEGILL